MSLGSFIAEQQSPAEMAKSMGLQSDGSGGYIDPETGQVVARTVNNELVFYDPMGGAISAQSDGASLTQSQPSWKDPVTGEITVPPGQAESPEEIAAIPDITPAKAPTGYSAFMNAKKKEMYDQQGTPEQEEIDDVQQEVDPQLGMQPEMGMGMGEEVKTLRSMFEDLADMKKLQDKQSEVQAQPGPKDKVEEPTPSLLDHKRRMSTISNNDGMTNGDKLRASHQAQDGMRRGYTKMGRTLGKEQETINSEIENVQGKLKEAFSGMDLSDPKTRKAHNAINYMFSSSQFPTNRSAQLRTYSDAQIKALNKRKENGDFDRTYKIDEKTGLPDIDALEQEIQDHQIFDFDAKGDTVKKLWRSLPKEFKGQFGGQGWSPIEDFVEHLNGGGRDFITKLPLPAYRRQIDHQIPGDRSRDMTLPKETRDYIQNKHQIRGIDFSLNQDLGEQDKIPGLQAIMDKNPQIEGLEGLLDMEDSVNIPRNEITASYRPHLQEALTQVNEDGTRVLKPGVDISAAVELIQQEGNQKRDHLLHALDQKFNLDNVSEEDREQAEQQLERARSTIGKISQNKGSTDIFRVLDAPNTFFADPSHGGGIPHGDSIMQSFIEDKLMNASPEEAGPLLEKWKETLKNANRQSGENWRNADRSGMSRSQVQAHDKQLKQDNGLALVRSMMENGLFDVDAMQTRLDGLEENVNTALGGGDADAIAEARKLRNRLRGHLGKIRGMNEDFNDGEDYYNDDEFGDDESYADVADTLQDLMFLIQKNQPKQKQGKGLKFESFRARIEE